MILEVYIDFVKEAGFHTYPWIGNLKRGTRTRSDSHPEELRQVHATQCTICKNKISVQTRYSCALRHVHNSV